MSAAGSLQNLNDIVVAGPVPWWPPAPGWYGVAAILLLLLGFMARRRWRRWRRDAYRRQALAELASIRAERSMRRLPPLLKRTALSAWPRPQVASLNGRDWHRFLDESAAMKEFGGGAGQALDRLAYGGAADLAGDDEAVNAVLDAAERWIRRHRSPREEG